MLSKPECTSSSERHIKRTIILVTQLQLPPRLNDHSPPSSRTAPATIWYRAPSIYAPVIPCFPTTLDPSHLFSTTHENKVSCQIGLAMKEERPAFACFPKLPPEVRVKIWTSALLSRVITITSKFNLGSRSCEVKVETPRIELLYVCQESRVEALRNYSQIKFNGDYGNITFVSWSRDTIFLDLPDEPGNADVDDIMAVLGTTFRPVQTLAVRVRAHVFWGFPSFLKQADDLRKLVFVDELERDIFPRNAKGYLYLIDLGSLGFIRGSKVNPYNEYRYFQDDVWITLVERHENDQFGERRWEMSLEDIAWVSRLVEIGERYCLLLPIT